MAERLFGLKNVGELIFMASKIDTQKPDKNVHPKLRLKLVMINMSHSYEVITQAETLLFENVTLETELCLEGEKITRNCDMYGDISKKERMKVNKFIGDNFVKGEQG